MKKKIIERNYGSIPHLSISKLSQQADKKIGLGQEKILTNKARDWKDTIVVTEKLDGSNVGVVKKDDIINAITRKGYEAITSPYEQHLHFSIWVDANRSKFSWLPEGYRIAGEWMIQAHGTRYNILGCSPFVAFDIFNDKNERLDYITFIKLCYSYAIETTPLLHIGQPISIKNAIKLLGDGFYGEAEKAEGVVYRCEREGKVDFLAKYVRSDKEDGKYLKEDREVWNEGFFMEIIK